MFTEVWRMKEREIETDLSMEKRPFRCYLEPDAQIWKSVLFTCIFPELSPAYLWQVLDWVNLGITLCYEAAYIITQ